MKRKVIEKCIEFKNTLKSKGFFSEKTLVLGMFLGMLVLNPIAAHAGINTGKLSAFDDILDFVLELFKKLGIGALIFGGAEIALSFKNDSPEQKDKGMKFALAGLALLCVAGSGSYIKGL